MPGRVYRVNQKWGLEPGRASACLGFRFLSGFEVAGEFIDGRIFGEFFALRVLPIRAA
jgi:hypothetical protein